MLGKVIKRSGEVVLYDIGKIAVAIGKALDEEAPGESERSSHLAEICETRLIDRYAHSPEYPKIEDIQDIVEEVLMQEGFPNVARKYILYRQAKASVRTSVSAILKIDSDEECLRDNANVDGKTSMGSMLKVGSTASTDYYLSQVIPKDIAEAHKAGLIHIHDLDFYGLTSTCAQIPIGQMMKGGFGTGHGLLREPSGIQTASALTAIAIQANQNDQHGGQSIPTLDYDLAPYVAKTFRKLWIENLRKYITYTEGATITVQEIKEGLKESGYEPTLSNWGGSVPKAFWEKIGVGNEKAGFIAGQEAQQETETATHQAMEGLIHNLNTLHSRAGGFRLAA